MMNEEMSFICPEDRIKCIFFSEFHPTTGPKITYQVPEDFPTKDLFDSIHVYVITKPQLMEHLISVTIKDWKVMGYPVCVEGDKYPRNALMFNLCFIFKKHAKTRKYEGMVKKLASYLISLEMETEFLYQENSKKKLPGIINEILTSINTKGICSLRINEANTIHLKVAMSIANQPAAVLEHQVPIFIHDKADFDDVEWDLTTQQVLPYIDGFNHISKIASEADVNISLVKLCVQNLVYHGVVKLLPIFQYSNIYMVTPELHKLTHNVLLREECLKYVSKHPIRLPTFKDVFVLYCSLRPSLTVKDWCNLHNPHRLNINEQKLILFGQMNGLIRRIHKYPILLDDVLQSKPKVGDELKKYLDGRHSYDEICCKVGCSYRHLEDIVDAEYLMVVCNK